MQTPKFSIEEIARMPLPGMAFPTALRFSPDDWMITYLHSQQGGLSSQLYAFLPATGEHHLLVQPGNDGITDNNVSIEEALRRERMRQWTQGVTQYAWAQKSLRLLIPLNNNLFVTDSPQTPLRCLVEADVNPIQDPQFSHNGDWVAYVQDDELYKIAFTGGQPQQITFGARGTGKSHGLAEYVAQEEMARQHGYWWSIDDQWIAFTEIDETHIPIYRILHQGKDQVGEGAQEDHRYPFAGQPNAHIRLGVVSATGGDPVWMDLGTDPDIYLACVDWLPDNRLAAQIQNRSQTQLDIFVFDIKTGQRILLLSEENSTWVNLHDMFRALAGFGEPELPGFIWASERSGYWHLYLYDGQGLLLTPLTGGGWQVDALVGVDEQTQTVYFTASLPTPLESHLFAVSFKSGDIRQITSEPGMHSVILDHAHQRFIDIHHSLNQPPHITLRSLADNSQIAVICDTPDPRIKQLNLDPPTLVNYTNREGDTLYGAIYRPPAEFGIGPFPTIVSVYGGPHAQMVTNGWNMTVAMRAQYLAGLGFLVFVTDNRGSARRGLKFEGAIKNNAGHYEVDDQVDGVRWLAAQGLADPNRVGIYGWSYGGYMAAMCLARAPEIFKAAVAGAPVTHWDGYDTHYTERYMGTPQTNPQGYIDSSIMAHVGQIQGKLLIVHGLIDENVHFRHTARLINALIHARIPYDLMLFPDERHMPRKPADRIYMEQRISDFFSNSL